MIKIADLVNIFVTCAFVNVLASLIFLYDKIKAQAGEWRIPENMLLFIAFLGSFGAYAAMRLLKHKTRKVKFYLVPVFLVLQTGLIIYILNPGFISVNA